MAAGNRMQQGRRPTTTACWSGGWMSLSPCDGKVANGAAGGVSPWEGMQAAMRWSS